MVSAISGNVGNIGAEQLVLMNMKKQDKSKVAELLQKPATGEPVKLRIQNQTQDEFVKEGQTVRSSLEAPKIEKMAGSPDEFVKSSAAAPAADEDKGKFKISYKKDSGNVAE